MRQKIVEYNGDEYKITFGADTFVIGIDVLTIYKKTKILFFTYWKRLTGYFWIDHEPDENPIDYAMKILKERENKIIEKTEYEKRLDEWFK